MAREMKDSGIEWIGEMPAEWTTARLQWHLEEIKVQNTPIQSEQVLSLTIEAGVIPYEEKGNQGNKSKENYEEYKLAYPGSLVVNSMNVIIGAVGISNYFGCVSPVYYVFKASKGTDLRYIYYLFTDIGFQKEMRKYAKGILEIRLRISANDMLKRIIPCPSYLEQKRIADRLDAKCAEIDAVIEKTKASIEEYKKLKQAIITRAVTKGIRGDRPMKDSRSVWLGTICQDYTVSRVGLHYEIILGKMICPEKKTVEMELYPYYCAANVHFDGVDNNDLKTMWFTPNEIDIYCVQKGDLLVVEGGAGAGGCAIVESILEKVGIQNSIMIVRPKMGVNSRYLNYLIQSLVKRKYIDVVCNKATIPHFTKDKLGAMPYLVLPEDEQKEIADYLDTHCSEIDALITKKEQLVTELESHKKSLIYEYVTGKREAEK